MKKLTILLLALLLALTLGACGGDSNGGGGDATAGGDVSSDAVYTVDEVKQKLADIMDIDESEFSVETRDTGTVISHGDWDIWFYTYVLNDSQSAPEMFDIQTWDDTPYDKRIDNNNHKVWVEERDDNTDEPELYTVIAMKGNLVISISSPVRPETVIEKLDLQ